MNSKESDVFLKIVIVGQYKVGKSTMISRYCKDVFNEKYTPTIGIDFKIQVFQINDKKVKLQIWDTADQERFRSFSYAYYCAASCMIFAYDITDKSSLDWLKDLREHAKSVSPGAYANILVGLKSDLQSQRQVTIQMGMKFWEEKKLDYFIEVSNETRLNLEKLFEDMIRLWLHKKSLNS